MDKPPPYSPEPPVICLSYKQNDGIPMEKIDYSQGICNEGYAADEDKDTRKNINDIENGSNDKDKEYDPWELPELKDTTKPWNEMNTQERFIFVFFTILKIIFFLGFLYLFICSLDFLGSAFKLLGGKAAGSVFRQNKILSNPIAGLMTGVLATVLLQSSSTTTSIVVTMVGAELLTVRIAIPIVMGANIGTSVTNTIVALGQITNKEDFRRAFAGATVHDMFNWLTVLVLLPIEIITGYLYHLSEAIIDSMHLSKYEHGKTKLLQTITKPLTAYVVQVDKSAITKIAALEKTSDKVQLLKTCCKSVESLNETTNATTKTCVQECEYLFKDTGMSESTIGAILLIASLILLCICLFAIVKILNSLLQGNIRKTIRKFVNYEFPGKMAYFTGYLAIIIGCGFTILVQSSSIFTSTLTPLVGVGVISLERMYPLTLGANIGTTTTGILAALAQDPEKMSKPLQVAMCHLFFNLSGILLFYPIPYLRFAIPLAKFLGLETEKYKWFAVVYLIFMFFLFPAAIFGLSLIGWEASVGVLVPILFLIILIAFIKVLQRKRPTMLPKGLRNFKFLPLFLRSLEPYNRVITKCICCRSCKSLQKGKN